MHRLPKQAAAAAALIFLVLMSLILALTQAETTVWVASRDITAGAALDPGLLQAKSVRSIDAPAGVVASPDEVAGKYAKTALYAGLPVPRSALTGDSGGRLLPSGQVLRRDEVLLPAIFDQRHGPSAELVRPGDLVDLIWVTAGEGAQARVILSNVRVAHMSAGDGAPVLYLALTREDATVLAYAATQGQLFATLLGPDAARLVEPIRFDPRTFTGPRASAPAPSASPTSAPRALPTFQPYIPPTASPAQPSPSATGGPGQ